MQLARLQGVDSPYSSIFADIDPVALPEVLSLIGEECGQKNLYSALVATAPELTSLINRKALLKDTMAKNTADITALDTEYARQRLINRKTLLQHAISNINKEFARLTAKRDELNKRMALLEMGDSKQSTKQSAEEKETEELNGLSGKKKRGRRNNMGSI